MTLTLTHVFNSHLDAGYGNRPLFRYAYRPQVPNREVPKPYFHPLYTLAGDVVTNFRPFDHLWHHGLAMTMAVLSGNNFWGGGTYVHGQGYVDLPNHGRIEHQTWSGLRCDDDAITLAETLTWISAAGEPWLAEERTMTVAEVDPTAGYWTLDHRIHLRNVRSEALSFGSPTTEGRPQAGYGSLFWRGPRSFLGGQVLAGGGLAGPEVMGQAAPWLAYTGRHDGSARESTLLFIDQPTNPRYPTKWFVRTDPFAVVSASFMFDEAYELPPGQTLALDYRLVLINGAWERKQIEKYLEAVA